ncbi:MAG: hypothetical protein FJ008_06220 [Chloroflexi bacterium]|nr:hypothetical protein [Chloroflexota bacterium]MBM3175388.1 hypothetical protein [Chloroflexota bacterium]
MPKDAHKRLGEVLLENLEVKPSSLGEALLELYEIADDCLRNGRCVEAFQYCQTALKLCDGLQSKIELNTGLDPSYAQAIFYTYMGTSYLNQGKLERALDCYDKSRSQLHGNLWYDRWNEGLLWHTIGKLYQLTGKLEEAFLAFQQSLFCLQSVTSENKDPSDLVAKTKAELRETRQLLRNSVKSKGRPRGAARMKPPDVHSAEIIRIPLVAKIAAGPPLLAEENIKDYLFLDKNYAGDATFALQVQGESLINAGIHNNDVVLIREQPVANNGDIVAVMLTDIDAEATLKRFYEEDSHIRLQPENDAEKPIIIVRSHHDMDSVKAQYQRKGKDVDVYTKDKVRVHIIGKVVSVLRTY